MYSSVGAVPTVLLILRKVICFGIPWMHSLTLNNIQASYEHVPATVKLSVSLSRVPLRHITVVSVLVIILDAVTCRSEVKLAFRGVPLTLMREMISRPRFKILGGLSVAKYEVV